MEWLTLVMDEQGPRRTATVLFFAEDGEFKACVHDREGERSLFRSASTVVELLEALEKTLARGGSDWRDKRSPGARRG